VVSPNAEIMSIEFRALDLRSPFYNYVMGGLQVVLRGYDVCPVCWVEQEVLEAAEELQIKGRYLTTAVRVEERGEAGAHREGGPLDARQRDVAGISWRRPVEHREGPAAARDYGGAHGPQCARWKRSEAHFRSCP
jgi:hypothetical protein